jgi:ubiquinone/menaquinone biosynthesis C-methylase UbiE
MKDEITIQNIKYYDTEASVYDKNRYGTIEGKRVDTFQKKLLETFFQELPDLAVILELGCGTGRFLPFIADLGYQLTGMDISPEMLRVAEKRVQKESKNTIPLILNNADTMPFEDDHFDAIYSILVLNLIPDYRKVFYEMARVVKPGGVIVFSVPNLSSVFFPAGIYVNLRGKTTSANTSGHRYSHWFSRSEITSVLQNTGFTIDLVLGQPPSVRIKDGAPPLKGAFSRWLFANSVYIKATRLSS